MVGSGEEGEGGWESGGRGCRYCVWEKEKEKEKEEEEEEEEERTL